MKKIFYVLLVLMLFLTGCKPSEEKNNDSFNFSKDINIMTIKKDYFDSSYGVDKYFPLDVKDKDTLNSIIDNLNNLKINEVDEEENIIRAEYLLEFSGMKIYIVSSNKIVMHKNDTNEYIIYNVIEGSYSFLDNLDYKLNPSFIEKSLADLDLTQKISIKSISKDATITLDDSNKDGYLKKLNEIRYMVANDDIVFEDPKYEIKIGENIINVVDENKIYVNGVKHFVTNGSFLFLDDINFENTGWLPWV